MTWNYRICRDPGGEYVLREVYYEDDRPVSITADPATFGCDAASDPVKEIAGALEMALRDVRTRPVFDVPEGWRTPALAPAGVDVSDEEAAHIDKLEGKIADLMMELELQYRAVATDPWIQNIPLTDFHATAMYFLGKLAVHRTSARIYGAVRAKHGERGEVEFREFVKRMCHGDDGLLIEGDVDG